MLVILILLSIKVPTYRKSLEMSGILSLVRKFLKSWRSNYKLIKNNQEKVQEQFQKTTFLLKCLLVIVKNFLDEL